MIFLMIISMRLLIWAFYIPAVILSSPNLKIFMMKPMTSLLTIFWILMRPMFCCMMLKALTILSPFLSVTFAMRLKCFAMNPALLSVLCLMRFLPTHYPDLSEAIRSTLPTPSTDVTNLTIRNLWECMSIPFR